MASSNLVFSNVTIENRPHGHHAHLDRWHRRHRNRLRDSFSLTVAHRRRALLIRRGHRTGRLIDSIALRQSRTFTRQEHLRVILLCMPFDPTLFLFLSLFFRWARLELLAGLLQEVLLLSLSLSIIIDAINKLINPNHIEDPSAMIYLGATGVCIGLLGLLLFRGYHHDHNIGEEIVEQKKNDFVQSVCNTIRIRDLNNENVDQPLIEATSMQTVPELVISETPPPSNHQREKHDSILPSLTDTYTNAFVAADGANRLGKELLNNHTPTRESQLRVPEATPRGWTRSRSISGESMVSSTSMLDDESKPPLVGDIQETRIYATLHALCLHSLVNIPRPHRRSRRDVTCRATGWRNASLV